MNLLSELQRNQAKARQELLDRERIAERQSAGADNEENGNRDWNRQTYHRSDIRPDITPPVRPRRRVVRHR